MPRPGLVSWRVMARAGAVQGTLTGTRTAPGRTGRMLRSDCQSIYSCAAGTMARPSTLLLPVLLLASGAKCSDHIRTLQLPFRPHPSLEPAEVVRALSEGLQANDSPTDNAGLQRLFAFTTFECRKALTGRQGAGDIDRFIRYAQNPVVNTLRNARAFQLHPATLIKATEERAALASMRSDVWGWETDGSEDDAPRHVRWVLQQVKYPGPLQHAWLVHELILAEYIFLGDMGSTTTD